MKCTGCKKNDAGEITEVYCEYDPDTKSGMPGANRKVKGTIHWVSCPLPRSRSTSLRPSVEVENPRDELAAIREAKTATHDSHERDDQPRLPECAALLLHREVRCRHAALSYLQFQRIGYFNVDKDSTPEKMVFNRTVGLKRRLG